MNAIQPTPYFFWHSGKIGIISDVPGGQEAMEKFPDLEVRTLAEWEMLASNAKDSRDKTP